MAWGGKDLAECRTNGATFDWRGKSYLFFVSSHWEVLGYGEEKGVEWAVTCELALAILSLLHFVSSHALPQECESDSSDFSKTLFTPAGVDIYLRTPSEVDSPAKQALLDRIVKAVQASEGISALTKDGFHVPGVVCLSDLMVLTAGMMRLTCTDMVACMHLNT